MPRAMFQASRLHRSCAWSMRSGAWAELDDADHARGARAIDGDEEIGHVGPQPKLLASTFGGAIEETLKSNWPLMASRSSWPPGRSALVCTAQTTVPCGSQTLMLMMPGITSAKRALSSAQRLGLRALWLASSSAVCSGPLLAGRPRRLGPLRLATRHLEEPRQADPAAAAAEGQNPDQPHHEGASELRAGSAEPRGTPVPFIAREELGNPVRRDRPREQVALDPGRSRPRGAGRAAPAFRCLPR